MSLGRILITGATGFVGRALVPALIAEGRAPTLALRRAGAAPAFAEARQVAVGSIGPATEWGDALAGVDTVIHLAAHVHVAPERARAEADLFDTVNHRASVRLYEEARRQGVGTFVFLSSITVLGGSSPEGGAFDDSSPLRPETAYGRSKRDAEDALRRMAGEGGGPTLVILRPPLIAGEGVGGNLGSLARLAASPWPLPLGGISNRRTLLSRANLVSAIAAALRGAVPGTFVLGDTTPLSTSEIVRELRAGARRSAPLVAMPMGLVAQVAGAMGLGGHAQRLFGDLVVDSSGFRRAYDWSDAIDIRDTLRLTGAAVRT